MKRTIFIFTILVTLTACGSYRIVDINKLRMGMTKEQVYEQIGAPQRVLVANSTRDGYLEVLEYKTYRDEVYALEFWNDYLTGYEFLYEDVQYVPASAPPLVMPVYGTQMPPAYYSKPRKTNTSGRPVNSNQSGSNNRPQTNQKPGSSSNNSQNTRPNNTNNQQGTRPAGNNSQQNPNTRSSGNNSQNTRSTENNSNTNSRSSRNDNSSGTRSTDSGRTNDNSGNQNTENGRSSGTSGRSN